MTIEIKQSTAHTFLLGPFVDSTDGVAIETGLATAMDNATTGIRLSKNGGNMADRNDATAPVHDEDGFYTIVLDATDTNTLGLLQVEYTEVATALPAWQTFSVVTANYWDTKYSTDQFDVNVTNMAANVLTAAATAADHIDLIWDETLAGHVTADTTGLLLNDWQEAGRLDLILDIIAVDTTTDIPALIATAQADLDIITGAAGALLDTTATSAQLVDDVWDEVLTGATHNVASSSGRRLRQLEAAAVLHEGTAQAATSNTITLDTGASAIDDFYNHARIVITENTGSEQERIIVNYVGSSKVATIAPPWITTPNSASIFEVEPGLSHAETNSKTARVGLAQAGAAGSITLDTGASAVTDFYVNDVVAIDAGTGIGQERVITAYNGTTKVATIEPNWITNPDTTSEFIIEEALSVADIFAISNDLTAADNLELDYDGTGLTRANSTIGTTTTNTDMRGTDSADVLTQINTALDAAISELTQGVPTATPSVRTGLMLMYMTLRNKFDSQTSGTDAMEIHNDAGTQIAIKLLTDDGSDYSEAKMTTGA